MGKRHELGASPPTNSSIRMIHREQRKNPHQMWCNLIQIVTTAPPQISPLWNLNVLTTLLIFARLKTGQTR